MRYLCCFFEVKLVYTSAAPIFLHFNLEKHHSHLNFSVLTTVYIFTAYFEILVAKQIHYTQIFFGKAQKRNCYISGNTLTSNNITGALFVVSFSRNIWIPPLSDISTWKCIDYAYFVLGYTLDTPSTVYFFAYKR